MIKKKKTSATAHSVFAFPAEKSNFTFKFLETKQRKQRQKERKKEKLHESAAKRTTKNAIFVGNFREGGHLRYIHYV